MNFNGLNKLINKLDKSNEKNWAIEKAYIIKATESPGILEEVGYFPQQVSIVEDQVRSSSSNL